MAKKVKPSSTGTVLFTWYIILAPFRNTFLRSNKATYLQLTELSKT